MNNSLQSLSGLFQAVAQTLENHRSELNAADPDNGNHGDHMVEIFDLAAQAAQDLPANDLAGAMEYAASQLAGRTDNGSAQVYARGLEQLAQQFRSRSITLDDLAPYVTSVLRQKDGQASPPASPPSRGGDVLKALLAGLAGWQQTESGQSPTGRTLDMGALFELGMAYMQAKQRGGSRVEVLADAAASASPLAKVPHRYQSGKLAIQSLLEAVAQSGDGDTFAS